MAEFLCKMLLLCRVGLAVGVGGGSHSHPSFGLYPVLMHPDNNPSQSLDTYYVQDTL